MYLVKKVVLVVGFSKVSPVAIALQRRGCYNGGGLFVGLAASD